MKRAYSPTEVQQMNIPSFPFEGKWEAAFGHPDRTGVWIIWGESGNGKSSFVMQLAKYFPLSSTIIISYKIFPFSFLHIQGFLDNLPLYFSESAE